MSDMCSVEGCGKPILNSRGWCNAHYLRWRRHGSPLAGGKPIKTARGEPQKFLERAITSDTEECIEWPYVRAANGYGQLMLGDKMHNVHRVICVRVHGNAPATGYHAAHNCGNRACCNPRHLRWATPSENNADKAIHGTRQFGERIGNAKLTASAVRECRALSGVVSQRELGKRFGVSGVAVGLAVAGKTWRDV